MRERSIVSITPRAGRNGEGREDLSSNARRTNRLAWTTHKTYGMGASGRLCCKLLPVDPPRMPRSSDSPGNSEDTDIQTRDCARFKDRRESGGKSTGISELSGLEDRVVFRSRLKNIQSKWWVLPC